MQVFRGTGNATLKKVIAISLWIIISVVVSLSLACHFEDDALFGTCLSSEFTCATGSTSCVWEGFVCNGVEDCDDGSDELSGGNSCDYSLIVCPGSDAATYDKDCADDDDTCHSVEPTHFMCESDGACIPFAKRCNGVIDCEDGSDEGRGQNCQTVISQLKCDKPLNITVLADGYSQKWTGMFKCNNGQCIDAQYACDGTPDDCVDGSDEYPDFNKARETPWKVACPYAALVDCSSDEVLCKQDGRCISKSAVCDGTNDCPDGADEKNCEYSCQNAVKNQRKFQCGGTIASVNGSHIIAKVDANTTNMIKIEDTTDWDALFSGSTGACIPISWRCDGTSDCDDNSDEELCSLFSCGDDEYQCTDTGLCITTSWLCDGIDDCVNAEDETSSVCNANGVNPSSNSCIQDGYFYQCPSSLNCLFSYQMCDGYSDCQLGEDEVATNCDNAWSAATSTTTQLAVGGSGSLSCGQSYSGTTSYSSFSYSFVGPSDSQVLIHSCDSDNEGDIYFYITDTNMMTYIYSETDWSCSCSNRGIVDTPYLTTGTTYNVEVNANFMGNYKFTVLCGSGSLTAPTTCTESASSFSTTYYWGP